MLCTSAMREIENAQNLLNILHKYSMCVIRIHFPNRLVLQSVFKSTETVLDIINFVRKYLVDDSLDFCLCMSSIQLSTIIMISFIQILIVVLI